MFSINLILPAHYDLGVDLVSNRNTEIFVEEWGGGGKDRPELKTDNLSAI
jgi:hypothetical protein